jgi:hypothetical protein
MTAEVDELDLAAALVSSWRKKNDAEIERLTTENNRLEAELLSEIAHLEKFTKLPPRKRRRDSRITELDTGSYRVHVTDQYEPEYETYEEAWEMLRYVDDLMPFITPGTRGQFCIKLPDYSGFRVTKTIQEAFKMVEQLRAEARAEKE